eukprot:TRINITY_DN79360_c0_g1_i1.p1 TRINITY_DN79360_c0_g1~~TRINITY_DN79360_c0_g1_i1.p1  ORF type:complete len:351 (-),score=58.71 TRINITY_DN79360_c0_g1_i1:285-1337(-)
MALRVVFFAGSLAAVGIATVQQAEEISEIDEALSVDSECANGQGGTSCSLNALQLKGQKISESKENLSAQELWHGHHHHHHTGHGHHHHDDKVAACCSGCPNGFCSPGSGSCHASKGKPYYKSCRDLSHEASKGCTQHEERIANLWASCADAQNAACASCGIYSAMNNPGMHGGGCPGVVYVGEKVVPKSPVSGGEAITANNAAALSNVWSCAVKKSGASPSMALIMNPWRARTQHHLHVIVKELDSRGHSLVQRLEHVTKCQTGKWHDAHWACHYSKAQLYSSLPPVFKEVMDLASTGAVGHLVTNPAGQPTLASTGISVLYICGGKPVVLVTGDGHGGCSVEHAMTSR